VYDLLIDPVISVKCRDGLRFLSLPDIFALLAHDGIGAFAALRPHQAPAWHAFLVQVGALALQHASLSEVPREPDDWRVLLTGLAGEYTSTAWSLVVKDPTRPALLQSALPHDNQLAEYNKVIDTPDALDLLVTAKNHDLKAERMNGASPEHWLYALMTLQTFEGVMGAGGGKYGIARMNGGYGSRPMLGLVPDGGPGARFMRDVTRLLAARPAILSRVPGLGTNRQIGLVWLEPWDGKSQLMIEELDPFFVEICRLVRLEKGERGIRALGVGSKSPRIAAPKDMKGVTGDPWAPIERSENKVLSITGGGFGYAQLVDLLDRSKFERPPLAEVDQGDAAHGLTILAAALARGQGKTEGFHVRGVPVSNSVAKHLIGRDATDALAHLGRARVDEVGEFTRKVFRPSLFMLFQGGPEQVEFRKATTAAQVEPWTKAFETEIDRVFFDALFAEFEARAIGDQARADAGNRRWREQIVEIAQGVFERATAAAPRNAARWYRARSRSRSYLENRARENLKLTVGEKANERNLGAV
jgi:CRISPR system Cascade subunit CasA